MTNSRTKHSRWSKFENGHTRPRTQEGPKAGLVLLSTVGASLTTSWDRSAITHQNEDTKAFKRLNAEQEQYFKYVLYDFHENNPEI